MAFNLFKTIGKGFKSLLKPKNLAVIGLAAGASIAFGPAGVMAVSQFAGIAGLTLSVVGAVTGNKDLQNIGGFLGTAGILGMGTSALAGGLGVGGARAIAGSSFLGRAGSTFAEGKTLLGQAFGAEAAPVATEGAAANLPAAAPQPGQAGAPAGLTSQNAPSGLMATPRQALPNPATAALGTGSNIAGADPQLMSTTPSMIQQLGAGSPAGGGMDPFLKYGLATGGVQAAGGLMSGVFAGATEQERIDLERDRLALEEDRFRASPGFKPLPFRVNPQQPTTPLARR